MSGSHKAQVINLNQYREENQEHGCFNGALFQDDTEEIQVAVAPLSMLGEFVFKNQKIKDKHNIILRSIVYDWLINEGYLE